VPGSIFLLLQPTSIQKYMVAVKIMTVWLGAGEDKLHMRVLVQTKRPLFNNDVISLQARGGWAVKYRKLRIR